MPKKIYMGGICGMGMAPLACFLKAEGCEVSGFDDTPNASVRNFLESRGIVFEDAPEYADEFVISSALAPRTEEFSKHFKYGKLLRRGEKWAEICADRKLIAVVGSHGKSSVSAMMAHAILKENLDAGYLVGAIPNAFEFYRECAAGKFVASEIDESDGTIEHFNPEVLVALNADLDHIDTYADNNALSDMFVRLFKRTRAAVVCPDDDRLLLESARRASVKPICVKLSGDFIHRNKTMALAALEAAFGRPFPADLLDDFKGVQRRQDILFDNGKSVVVSDYAHHPSEVASFVKWFAAHYADKRRVLVFQPHRYSRTKRFAEEFAKILGEAKCDGIYIMDVYPASEPFDKNGTSIEILKRCTNAIYLDRRELPELISQTLSEDGRAFAMVGAGDAHFDVKNLLEKY